MSSQPPALAMSHADISSHEIALVNEVLRSGVLSCGPVLEQFESAWAAHLGMRAAVAVSSGTAALHLALIAAGVQEGNAVLTSPFSFVASANAILYQRAVPVFVDVDPATLNIDPAAVADTLDDLAAGGTRAARRLPRRGVTRAGSGAARAILPVHVFGQPADMPPIVAAARQHGAWVIEDACEAVGAAHRAGPAGTLGDAAVFGFFPNKQMTMGEGGVIVTNREDWAAEYRSLRNQGRTDSGAWLEYSRLGYNYRLGELNAALGLGQLRRLDTLLANRARVAAEYTNRLATPGVSPIPLAPSTAGMTWFVYVVRLDPSIDRDAVMAALAADGVPSRPYFPPIHLQAFYRERFGFAPGDFPHAEAAGRSCLALPFHGALTCEQIDYVVDRLDAAVAACRRGIRRPADARRRKSGACT